MGYTYLSLLDSPGFLQILVILLSVIKPLLPNFLGRAIVILNFERRFRNFIALVENIASVKTLLQQGLSEPEFYGDLVYRFRKNVGNSNFSEHFKKLINRYKKLAVAWILCGRLHAKLSTQSLLTAMLHSLIARRRIGPQTQ